MSYFIEVFINISITFSSIMKSVRETVCLDY